MYQKISPPKFTRSWIKYGLGYDSINDDLKVVAAVTPTVPKFTSDGPSTVHVFSSKLSSWKSIEDFGRYSCHLFGRGSVLNGSPHWVACGITDIDGYYFRIACFDVMEEKFKEVPMPIYEEKVHLFKVGVLDGCLCMVDSRLESLTFWVMKEYGVKESWTKLFVVSNVPPNEPGEPLINYCELLCFTKDGEFVLKLRSGTSAKFAIYNPKRKTYKRIEKPENWKGHEIDIYVESLVSPLG
ncbi:hypothetical protein RHMOL_Rhmol04G0342300 [Rhododendron molle]|uniref:Uncharacterized protein n=1 Tax=Rhododendron molle TaxID=49168 RepID=A0ACC0P779_RHOML|nr:hypothetical protein RHMOL_Rhmol04G0342300 [Rhododendron molle]